MIYNELYPLVQELVFGEDNRLYVALDWEGRKFLGRNLPNLLYSTNITIDHSDLEAWDVCVEGMKKYMYFIMPYNYNVMKSNLTESSIIIDLRG